MIDIYRRRWGLELFYRHFKQTYDRRKLRKKKLKAQQLSVAKALKAFRRMQRDYLHPVKANCSLNELLHHAVRDTYQRRNKTSRNYPRKKRSDPPAGAPRISVASKSQVERAQQIKQDIQKGLTA